MSKLNSPLIYKDIWYGEYVDETNYEFKNHHLVSLSTFKTLLLSIGFKIISITKPPRSDIYLLKIRDSLGNKFNILFETIKHSGILNNNRLRVHVNPTAVRNIGNEKVYLFAGYNAGDELLFTIGEITDFCCKSKIKTNNSSLWIGSIEELMRIYEKEEYIWYRTSDDVVLQGITSKKLHSLKSQDVVNKFFIYNSVNDNLMKKNNDSINLLDNYNVEPEEVDFAALKKMTEKSLLSRNLKYRDIALQNANYTCELCGKKDTFINNCGKEYFEGHHLIMYNVPSQLRFEKSLDIPRNIICLCPECHKKIHFASDQIIKDLVVKLFIKHKDLFGIYEIDSLDDILNDYFNYREENDQNELH